MIRARFAGWLRTVVALDREWSGRLRIPDGSRWTRFIALFAAHLGDSPLWAVVSALVYWRGDARLRAAVILMAAAVVIAAALNFAVKNLVRRARPGGYSPLLYSRSMDQHSFPSGHAARVGAVAVTMFAAYPSLWPILLAYALGVAIARVALGAHYLGDVAFGLLLGSLVGVACVLVLHGCPLSF